MRSFLVWFLIYMPSIGVFTLYIIVFIFLFIEQKKRELYTFPCHTIYEKSKQTHFFSVFIYIQY